MINHHPHAQVSARLDTHLRWDFEAAHAAETARLWAGLIHRQPWLFNGPVLMSHSLSGDEHALHVTLLRTDYATFMAWRELGRPRGNARLCFPIAALRTADDYWLLGTMSARTSNAGLSYFPSGSLSDDDVLADGTVALERAMLREIEEETGLTEADLELGGGWMRIESEARCAFFKAVRVKWSRDEVAERIAAFLAGQAHPELSGVVFVKTRADLQGLELPAVQRDYFARVLVD